jgi:hypothetical protein
VAKKTGILIGLLRVLKKGFIVIAAAWLILQTAVRCAAQEAE